MADTLITILMPAYNAARTIADSINSVLSQTHKSWILLVLDDGSTDETPAIVGRYRTDERIRYVRLPHRGVSCTSNYGLETAETDWIARIDSDDLWKPERLSRQLEFLAQNPAAQIIGSWGERVNDRGVHLTNMNLGPTSVEEYERWRTERKPLYIIHSSMLARRQTLLENGGYRESDFPADDLHLWTRVARKNLVLVVPLNLTSYRISSQGISARGFVRMSAQSERLEFALQTGQEVTLEQYENEILSRVTKRLSFLRRTYARYWFRQGGSLLVNGRKIRGLIFLAGSTCLNPQRFIKRIVFHT
jgi:glycosyltransferase involved in cell wall biosynthesis